MLAPIDGRRRFRGELIGTEGECVRLRCGDAAAAERAEILLRIDDMMEARLVLTDALISESLRRSKHGERNAQARGADEREPPRRPKHVNAALEQARRVTQPEGD